MELLFCNGIREEGWGRAVVADREGAKACAEVEEVVVEDGAVALSTKKLTRPAPSAMRMVRKIEGNKDDSGGRGGIDWEGLGLLFLPSPCPFAVDLWAKEDGLDPVSLV
jgi:hypothetical protein